MMAENKETFIIFKLLNDSLDNSPNDSVKRAEFNKLGEKILEIVKKYEDILCGRTETSHFGKYSANLSEKFWGELRKNFSLIDEIGVTTI